MTFTWSLCASDIWLFVLFLVFKVIQILSLLKIFQTFLFQWPHIFLLSLSKAKSGSWANNLFLRIISSQRWNFISNICFAFQWLVIGFWFFFPKIHATPRKKEFPPCVNLESSVKLHVAFPINTTVSVLLFFFSPFSKCILSSIYALSN